jgi:hypothetical protein
MLIGSKRKTSKITSLSLKVLTNDIEKVDEFKYLGVVFSTDMSWSSLIGNLSAKINKRLGLLKRIKHLLFDYGDIVWGDKDNITSMQALQVLQNKAAKFILDRPL